MSFSVASHRATIRRDLRGVKCPLNWAHAKVRLESTAQGGVVHLRIE
jgi:TusA-related sulfurtransferase